MKYAVIYEKSANGYGAYTPDLPGCAAVGATLDATKRRIEGCIEMHLAGMREDGEPSPSRPPKSGTPTSHDPPRILLKKPSTQDT